jgi:hypothetical protein
MKECQRCKTLFSPHGTQAYCRSLLTLECQYCGSKFEAFCLKSLPQTCSRECHGSLCGTKSAETKIDRYGASFVGNIVNEITGLSGNQSSCLKRYGVLNAMQNPRVSKLSNKRRINNRNLRMKDGSHVQPKTSFRDPLTRARQQATKKNVQFDSLPKRQQEKLLKKYSVLLDSQEMLTYCHQLTQQLNRKLFYGDLQERLDIWPGSISTKVNNCSDLAALFNRQDSFLETLVVEYLATVGLRPTMDFVQRCRKCLSPTRWEIDICFHPRKLGIEVQDFASHSRNSDAEAWARGNKSGPSYHLKKQLLAKNNNINLVELWEDEILNRDFHRLEHYV